jgi:hypothetical protein
MKAYEIIECLNQLFSEFDRLALDGPHKIATKEERVLEAFFVDRRS